MRIGTLSLGVKRPERDVHRPYQTRVDVKERVDVFSTPSTCLYSLLLYEIQIAKYLVISRLSHSIHPTVLDQDIVDCTGYNYVVELLGFVW